MRIKVGSKTLLSVVLAMLFTLESCTVIGYGSGMLIDAEFSYLQENELSQMQGRFKRGMKIVVYSHSGQIYEGKFLAITADSLLQLKMCKDQLKREEVACGIAGKWRDRWERAELRKEKGIETIYTVPLINIKHITVLKRGEVARWVLASFGLMADFILVALIITFANMGL
ncbi:hypothetical protein ACFLQV_01120 [Calditrichota bacterium]